MLRLLRGEVGYVIGGLRQMGTKRELPSKGRKKLKGIRNNLNGNRHRMRYEYLKARCLCARIAPERRRRL